MSQTIAVIRGDGIGPEIVDSVLRVLDALKLGLNYEFVEAGMAAQQSVGELLPQATLDAITRHKIALKGPLTTPIGGGFSSLNVELRKRFDLYANVRPAITFPGTKARYENIDIITVRENTEGAYEMIVDNTCMQLVMNPQQFDVIVTTNLFGDIISDLCAGLVGGLGLAPGANIGTEVAIFEAVHGSAPDIAGKGVANPAALLLGAAQMLSHIGHEDQAVKVREVIRSTLAARDRLTPDLGGSGTTTTFTDALIERVDA